MGNSICKDCINREICGSKGKGECEHYDIALTRSEIINILNEYEGKNPSIIPAILGAIQKTYRINIAY